MENTVSTKNEQVIAIRQQIVSNERHREYWSDDEKDKLKEMFYAGTGITEMALELHRSEMAIVNQLNALSLFRSCRAPKRQKKECLCPGCSHYAECNNPCKAGFSD